MTTAFIIYLFFYLFLSFVHGTNLKFPIPPTCKGKVNSNPIWTKPPVLYDQTTNGKLFRVGSSDNPVNILHLYGTPYEKGVAQGVLLKKQLSSILPDFFEFIDSEAKKYLKSLPKWLADVIVNDGIKAALDITALMTENFTPQHFFDEMRGIADGSGIEYSSIIQVNLFPELIKASCSMIGAWSDATEKNLGLMQLRALDWGINNPFRLFPLVTVYHAEKGDGHDFATVTWPGMLLGLTGYSSQGVALSQKYFWSYDNVGNVSSRSGIPWTMLFRDILQYDRTWQQGYQRMLTAKRTCASFVGLGDHTTGEFRVFEYSHDYVHVFGPNTPFPGYAPQSEIGHPSIQNIVYIDKTVQPNNHPCLSDLIKQSYGSLDTASIRQIASIFQTGDFHLAISDFKNNLFSVSFATQLGIWPNSTADPAYDRELISLNMTSIFNE